MLNFGAIEKKWQERWDKAHAFKAEEKSSKPKFYCLEMFPYPSASFLHMGHVRNYTIGDAIARFKRLSGYNVLYPMGYDSFGLPAENAAKKQGIHPRKYTESAIAKIMEYQKALGNSYDWGRVIATHEPRYYKWNQWFFLKFLEKGLVYRKKAPVNWCHECNSVLANEEVVNGCCWRHEETPVEQKELDQWFLKTTAYADELLEGLDDIQWSDRLKTLQRNWIGKSQGLLLDFGIKGSAKKLQVFTTRPDTVFGVTFVVVSPKHPLIEELAKTKMAEIREFARKTQSDEDKAKEGVFTGSYAINPFTREEVPIYAANFVVTDYGTGAVMAVPAHDQRDYEFAKKYGLPIKHVIAPLIIDEHSKPRAGKKEVTRNTIVCVLRRKNAYATLIWKKHDWKTLIIGGIEDGEDPVAAGIREIREETGYRNVSFVRVLGETVVGHYYTDHKDENRTARMTGLLFDLVDDQRDPRSAEDHGAHDLTWTPAQDVPRFVNFTTQKMFAERALGIAPTGAYTDPGILVHSGTFAGLQSTDAIAAVAKHAEQNKFGKRVTQYKLRDWLVSRQRYWGTPIPIVYCDKCGTVQVPEKELPVLLPEKADFTKEGNPLSHVKEWIETKCPKCKGKAKRETDTMGGFVDSSWYFLRYCSPNEENAPFDKKAAAYWMPVDQYIGGIEHAVGHLIYSRFWTKAARDLKLVAVSEPFTRLFNQGTVYKDGHKMSKSFGNIVTQTELSDKYGIDAARVFALVVASPESDMEWTDNGIEGVSRFILKFHGLFERYESKDGSKDRALAHKLNQAIQHITNEMDAFRLNTAIQHLMDLANRLHKWRGSISAKAYAETIKVLCVLASPFLPHIAEECWEKINGKGFVSNAQWPKADPTKIDPSLDAAEELLEQTLSDVRGIQKLVKLEKCSKVTLFLAEPWKHEYYATLRAQMEKTKNAGDIIKALMQTELKKYGGDIAKLTPKLVSEPGRVLAHKLDHDKEAKAYADGKKELEEALGCTVEIIPAEKSKEAKARNAWPGKPAILVA